MGVTDVPQWLLPAYVQAMSHAGAMPRVSSFVTWAPT